MKDNELTKILDKIIANLEYNKIDLQETPALFKWKHPEKPEYEFQLLIKIVGEDDIPLENHNVH